MTLKRMMMAALVAAILGGLSFVPVTMADVPSLSVENVTFRQRYPWNGLVDIDCTVNCSDPTTNISLYVSAKDSAANKSLAVRSVWLESDATHTNALEVKSGTHRLVWDAGKDSPNFVGDVVTVEVQALLGAGLYLVIDLSGGTNAASYPISYLDAEPQGGWTDEYKTTKLVLRRIQPGTFTMGCETTEKGCHDDSDAVPHEVTISQPFYIGVFEVTQKQYELVTGIKPSYFSNSSCYEARPVEQVSWNKIRGNSSTYNWPGSSEVDSSTFMGKIRAKTGITTFDLPTEAVWEYACRAGTTTALNSGKNLTSAQRDANMAEVGRYWYNGEQWYMSYSPSSTVVLGTAKVGSYQPNAWGLYDMHGNVSEWALDWYQSRSSFTASAVADPVGPPSGSCRVLRGGSWRTTSASYCRSASRGCDNPSREYDGIHIGFRLCCSAGQ